MLTKVVPLERNGSNFFSDFSRELSESEAFGRKAIKPIASAALECVWALLQRYKVARTRNVLLNEGWASRGHLARPPERVGWAGSRTAGCPKRHLRHGMVRRESRKLALQRLHVSIAFLAPPRRGLPPPPDAGGRPPSPPGPTRSARTRRATARTVPPGAPPVPPPRADLLNETNVKSTGPAPPPLLRSKEPNDQHMHLSCS